MATFHFRRVFLKSLQNRFFTTTPSSNLLKKASPLLKQSTETTKFKNGVDKSVSFPVEYLTKSCGLSLESAISVSKRVDLDECDKQQFDSLVSYLKSHEFNDTQVIELIKKYPTILFCKISSTLEPKFVYLEECGIKGLDLPKFVMMCPYILFRSLDDHLKPAMSLLKRFIRSPEQFLIAFNRGSWLLTWDKNKIQLNAEYLIEQGVPNHRLEWFIVRHPRRFMQGIDRLKYGVEMIKSMGVKPNDAKFIHTLRVLLSMSEVSWKRKVKIFESLGWSYDEVITTFVSDPHCLACSEKKLKTGMDYCVNILKIDRKSIIAHPMILKFSLEKRVIPRFAVWKILGERNLIRGEKCLWMLNVSEKDFLEKYVIKHSKSIPTILSTYEGLKGAAATHQLKKIASISKITC